MLNLVRREVRRGDGGKEASPRFKRIAAVGLTVMTAVILLCGVVAYSYLKPAAAASGPLAAIPLTQPTATGTATGAGSTVYTIDQASSEARYVIDETLNGSPVTVVGTTDQVAGQIALDLASPATAQVGTIQINARTLTTDSANRDRATQNRILETATYEYITFTPTALAGLPVTAVAGESYTFQIAGQLTIRDVTREATFTTTVTPAGDGTLRGSATTTIAYADWGLSVPEVPIVTGLAETVTLEIDFVARAQ
jgi:polyisoprenoid-binding protein YceI